MPNIEFHGLGGHQNDDLRVVLAKIMECLADAPYAEESVVSFVESSVVNKKGEHESFFRIWTTDKEECDDIVRRLEPLDMGIELPPLLDRYVPSKTEQEAARAKLLTLRPVAGTDANFDYAASAAAVHSDDGSDKPHARQGTGHIDES